MESFFRYLRKKVLELFVRNILSKGSFEINKIAKTSLKVMHLLQYRNVEFCC
jgi:hypothetical protein